jgi:hypothetical protein
LKKEEDLKLYSSINLKKLNKGMRHFRIGRTQTVFGSVSADLIKKP